MSAARQARKKGGRRRLNGVVYILVAAAVGLGGAAAWQRYMARQQAGTAEVLETKIDTAMTRMGVVMLSILWK